MDYRTLPKLELHCHLDGSLSFGAIRQLAAMAGVALPETEDGLKALVTASAEAETLMEYLQPFDVIRPLLQTKEALTLAAYDLASKAHEDGVVYLEVRFAPELSMDQGLTAVETVEAVLAGLAQAREEFGIIGRAIVCGMRQSAPQVSQDIFEAVARLAPQGLVGFDFAGNEVDFPPEKLAATMQAVADLGLPFTLHAGECHCAENVVEAITLGAKRIGHGTALYNRPDLVDQVVESGATIEICLTSNLQTKGAATIEHFPYPILKEKGAKFCINTDNRTVSQTTLTQEYALFAQHFGTSLADFYAINQTANQASFGSTADKSEVAERLDQGYLPLLAD